jgi:hypothetical protein
MSDVQRAPARFRITGTAMAMAAVTTLILRLFAADLRWGPRPAWLVALGVSLVLLAVRIAVLAAAARHGEMRWSRLLLPAIFLVEGLGIWWEGGGHVWQVARFATAIALELALVVLAIHHLWRAPHSDELPEDRLARPLERLLPPRAARLIALELVVLGLALRFIVGGWRRPLPAGFTYHREAVLRMLLPVLPLMAAADVVLLELVILPHAARWLRIVVHVLAIYGVLWMIGLWASFRGRPHRIHAGRAMLHRGLLRHVEVSLDRIASIGVMPSFSDDWKLRAYRKGAIRIDISGPTILDLRLRAPVRPIGVLGRGPASDHLLVAVDDPTAFIAALAANLECPAAGVEERGR